MVSFTLSLSGPNELFHRIANAPGELFVSDGEHHYAIAQ